MLYLNFLYLKKKSPVTSCRESISSSSKKKSLKDYEISEIYNKSFKKLINLEEVSPKAETIQQQKEKYSKSLKGPIDIHIENKNSVAFLKENLKDVNYKIRRLHNKLTYTQQYSEVQDFLINTLDMPCYFCQRRNSDISRIKHFTDFYNTKLLKEENLDTYTKQNLYNSKIKESIKKVKEYPTTLCKKTIKMELHRFFCELKDCKNINLYKWNTLIRPKIPYMSPLMLYYYSNDIKTQVIIYQYLEQNNYLAEESTEERIVPKINIITTREELKFWCETSPYNMMPLCTNCHRGSNASIHDLSFSEWFPKMSYEDKILNYEVYYWKKYHEKRN